MTREEFTETFIRCIKKAELKYSWWLTEDIDEDAELYLNEDGNLFVKDIKTPYTFQDVEKVRYRQFYNDDEEYEYDEQNFYVRVWFKNGDRLQMGMRNYRDYICLAVKNSGQESKSFYDEKVFDYWKGLDIGV